MSVNRDKLTTILFNRKKGGLTPKTIVHTTEITGLNTIYIGGDYYMTIVNADLAMITANMLRNYQHAILTTE